MTEGRERGEEREERRGEERREIESYLILDYLLDVVLIPVVGYEGVEAARCSQLLEELSLILPIRPVLRGAF